MQLTEIGFSPLCHPSIRQISCTWPAQCCRSGSTKMVALLSMDLVSNPVMCTGYHIYQEQYYQALPAPTVASSVSQSRASRLSRAAASLQRNGPRWPSTKLGAMDQDVIWSMKDWSQLRHQSVCKLTKCTHQLRPRSATANDAHSARVLWFQSVSPSTGALVWFSWSKGRKWIVHIIVMFCCANSCCRPSVTLPAIFTLSSRTTRQHTVRVRPLRCWETKPRILSNQTCCLPTVLTPILWTTTHGERCSAGTSLSEASDDLKQRVIEIEAWSAIQQSVIDQAIDQRRDRLNVYVKAKGKHFDHLLSCVCP